MFGKGKNDPKDEFSIREVKDLKEGSGTVIIYEAKLPHKNSDVLQYGYLIVELGASIGMHRHSKDSELWNIQKGMIAYYYDDEPFELIGPGSEKVCLKGHEHALVNTGDSEAVIAFTKFK